jgi:hypothetical protein
LPEFLPKPQSFALSPQPVLALALASRIPRPVQGAQLVLPVPVFLRLGTLPLAQLLQPAHKPALVQPALLTLLQEPRRQ